MVGTNPFSEHILENNELIKILQFMKSLNSLINAVRKFLTWKYFGLSSAIFFAMKLLISTLSILY